MSLSVFLSLATVAFSMSATAQAALPEPGKLKLGSDLTGHVYLDSSFQYNFNRPPVSSNIVTSPQNNYRAYDRAHYQFVLNQARVGLSYDANPVGFDLQIGAGPQLDTLNSADGTVERTFANIRRAVVRWGNDTIGLEIGRFDALTGLERIDSVDNWNYSRSFTFTNSQPKTFTGLRFNWSLVESVMLSLIYSNGADRNMDNNRGKLYGLRVARETDKSTLGLSYFASPERAASSAKWRNTVTVFGKYMVTNTAGLGIDASFVNGDDETIGTAQVGSARQYGTALYGTISLASDHWTSVRGEWFRDEHGMITQLNKQVDLFGAALTHRFNASRNLSLWAEARWDGAGENIYFGKSGTTTEKNQVTGLLGATLAI
jgi:hypothetical protein